MYKVIWELHSFCVCTAFTNRMYLNLLVRNNFCHLMINAFIVIGYITLHSSIVCFQNCYLPCLQASFLFATAISINTPVYQLPRAECNTNRNDHRYRSGHPFCGVTLTWRAADTPRQTAAHSGSLAPTAVMLPFSGSIPPQNACAVQMCSCGCKQTAVR